MAVLPQGRSVKSRRGIIAVIAFMVCWHAWAYPIAEATAPTSQSSTQPAAQYQDVSEDLAPLLKTYKLPGLAVVVLRGDDIVASGVTGVRKKGAEPLISIHDQFHIGSCTKAMSATLCGILVEEGRLRWDSTIEGIFPELVGKIDDGYRKITLEQLLTHRSGLAEDRKPAEILQRMRQFQGTLTEARYAWIKEALQSPPASPAGKKHQYSNLGYIIAGAMCERVTGFTWEDLMRTRIFTPLGMDSAGFGPPGKMGKIDQPLGHTAGNMPIEPSVMADNPAASGPAGTVHCSLPDWGKFLSAHLLRNKLLKPETFQKLQTPVEDPQIPYAMGWLVIDRDWAAGEALHHSGSNTMWYAIVWAAPAKQFAVLVATNCGSPIAPKACDEVAQKMIEKFAGKD